MQGGRFDDGIGKTKGNLGGLKNRETINFTLPQVKSYYEIERALPRRHLCASCRLPGRDLHPLKKMAPCGAIPVSAFCISLNLRDGDA